MTSPPRILLCRCDSARVIPPHALAEVAGALGGAQMDVIEVEDICGMAARKNSILARFAQHDGMLQIIACYPRAIKWLFASADAPLPLERTQFFNLRTQSASEVVAGLMTRRRDDPRRNSFPAVEAQAAETPSSRWLPWFPVIDFDLCTQCLQCLSFCLFGVYGLSPSRQIAVVRPENCKTNCPACSRVCPEAAIIFPKFAKPPINGAAVNHEGLRQESMKTDISAVLGGDIYASLRERSRRAQPRFSSARDPQTAFEERQRFLAALVANGEIPADVLATLPTLAELQSRAVRAKEQAQAALAAAKKPLT